MAPFPCLMWGVVFTACIVFSFPFFIYGVYSIYGIHGREITKYMVIYGGCVRFWPTQIKSNSDTFEWHPFALLREVASICFTGRFSVFPGFGLPIRFTRLALPFRDRDLAKSNFCSPARNVLHTKLYILLGIYLCIKLKIFSMINWNSTCRMYK